MKKFTRASLIISAAFFVTGAIILVICSIFAGGRMRSELSNAVSSKLCGMFDIGFAIPWNFEDFGDNLRDKYLYYSDSANTYSGSYTDDKAASASDITELYLNLGDGKFTIAPSNDEYFHISFNGKGKCQYYTEGSAFYINAFYGNIWYNKNSLTLNIPDTLLRNADISVGAGSVSIASLKSDAIVISVGAGELIIDDVICSNIETGIGMGSVTIKNGSVQDADFEIGMGELTYTGAIAHDLSASVDMGSITLMLNDSQYDHNYEIDIDMGAITLGNAEYGGFIDYGQNIGNNADSTYSLECDMGSIEVKFKDRD